MEYNNISVEPIGQIDIVGRIDELSDDQAEQALAEIKAYMPTEGVPAVHW